MNDYTTTEDYILEPHHCEVTQEASIRQGERTLLSSFRITCTCGWIEKAPDLRLAHDRARAHTGAIVSDRRKLKKSWGKGPYDGQWAKEHCPHHVTLASPSADGRTECGFCGTP